MKKPKKKKTNKTFETTENEKDITNWWQGA